MFRDFINSFRSNQEFNFVSLRGGKFLIPDEKRGLFHRKFAEDVPNHTSLVWVPPKDGWSALHLDFDIYMSEDFHISDQEIINFALLASEVIYSFVQRSFGVFLTRKPSNTPHHTCGYKGGFHILCSGFVVTKDIAMKIREGILHHLEEFRKGKPITGKTQSLFDRAVYPYGTNGLLLLGDSKPGREPYACFFKGVYDKKWINEKRDLNTKEVIMEHAQDLWTWLYKTPTSWKRVGGVIPVEVSEVPEYVPYSFDLDLFLKNTKGFRPSNEEYKNMMMMCIKCDLDPTIVQMLCSKAWNEKDRPEETSAFLKKDDYKVFVLRKTIIDLLHEHLSSPPSDLFALEQNIFPRKKRYTKYNEYIKFTSRKRRHPQEIEDFLFDVVGYVSSSKSFVWSYSTEKMDKYGNQYTEETMCISRNPPFSESDDFTINMYPSYAVLKKILGKGKKAQEITSTLHTLSLKDAYDKCAEFLEYKPEYTILMSKFLKSIHAEHKLRRYSEVTFRPYTGPVDPFHSDQILNIFPGFLLDRYTPKKKIDIKTTYIWRYLVDVFAHGEEGPLLDHFLKSLAFQIQFPEQRSERITCIISGDQGVGKSQLFKIFCLLLGSKLCMWHDNMETYITRFNWENKCKLIHHVDDIQGCTKAETWKLFPKATSNEQQYEKKGDARITFPEYSNFFTTSNDDSPLHIKAGDRRQVIYIANSKYKQDRSFFGPLNDEFQNLDIGHALFMLLKRMDLTGWHPTINPPSDARMRTIAAGMYKSHIFISQFFMNRDWIYRYKSDSLFWGKDYRAKRQVRGDYAGQLQIRIKSERLYYLFRRFMKESFPSSSVHNLDTFCKEIANVGCIVPEKRQEMYRKNNYMVVDIYFREISRKMQDMYGQTLEAWDSEENSEKFEKNLKNLVEKDGRGGL